MKRHLFVLAALFALLAAPAFAQAPEASTHIRGTVISFSGETLAVHSRDGQRFSVAVPPQARIGALKKLTLADIKKGDFIGAAAAPDKNGVLHAQEVLIFPEKMRGAGEGHYPWDLTPNSTMTNATVAGVVQRKNSRTLTLEYKGGSATIRVDARTPIVTFAPGDRSLLKPGAAVLVIGQKQSDGSLVARVVTAEKNGVKPPM